MYSLSFSVTHQPTGIETTLPIVFSKFGNFVWNSDNVYHFFHAPEIP